MQAILIQAAPLKSELKSGSALYCNYILHQKFRVVCDGN